MLTFFSSLKDQNCSTWSAWGVCSSHCNEGYQIRHQTCKDYINEQKKNCKGSCEGKCVTINRFS